MSTTSIIINILFALMIVNIFFSIALIFFERRNPSTTWAWVVVLLFIPGLGSVLYMFLGQDLRKKKVFILKEEYDIAQIAHRQQDLLNHFDKSHNSLIAQDMDLIHLHLNNSNSIFTHNNHVHVLNNGAEKFPVLLHKLREAKHHIHMEYYIIRNDAIGRQVRDILVEKAQQGVQVRLLYDGMGCLTLPKSFFTPLQKAGGEIAEFYPPFLPHINIRVNYRNHRKIIVIDGKTGFIGGLNLGDEYLGLSPKYGFWRDIHLLVEGDAVDGLQHYFLMDWQFASHKKFFTLQEYFPIKTMEGNTGVQIVSSGPDSKWAAIRQGYLKMIMKAEKSIYIETPYLIPDDSLAEALKVAALGGVDVKIIIPCKPDHPFVFWASLSYTGDLLEAGARVFTYMNGFLHSKLLIVDGRICSIGTANFDMRSFKLNFEINAFIYDPFIAKQLEETFNNDLIQSQERTIKWYQHRPLHMRFKESVSRLVSPLL